MLEERITALRDRFERLTERERRMVAGCGVMAVLCLVFGVGWFITSSLSDFGERNANMRQALKDLETQRDAYLRAKAKSAQMESRLSHGNVRLQSYLEQAAKEVGIEIPESSERQAPAGKHFTEHAVDLRLRQVKLDALTRFLQKIESGSTLAVVTALDVKKRDDKHIDLDVEMTVSTYERNAPAKAAKKEGDKS